MMTPEEVQRTMEFILTSHANSAARMDRIEQNLGLHEHRMSRLEDNIRQLEVNIDRLEGKVSRLADNVAQSKEEQQHQRETLNVMIKISQDVLKALQMSADRIKRLESRSDSVDEMIKVLREILERGLKRPDDFRQE